MDAQETLAYLNAEAVAWFAKPEDLAKVRPIQLAVAQAVVDFETLAAAPGSADVLVRKTPNYERAWESWDGALSACLIFAPKEEIVAEGDEDFTIYVAVGSRVALFGKGPKGCEELLIRVQRGFPDASNDVCIRKSVTDAWKLIQQWRSEGKWTT